MGGKKAAFSPAGTPAMVGGIQLEAKTVTLNNKILLLYMLSNALKMVNNLYWRLQSFIGTEFREIVVG
jgi:hypothetical protein